MARPAGMRPDMIGLVKTGLAKGPRPPQSDPSEQMLARLANALGVMIDPGAPRTPPARSMFPRGPEGDAAFERHLERLGEQLRAGMKNRRPERKERLPAVKAPKRPNIYRAGQRISWLDLKLVSCAGCSRKLLGPSDECVREHARAIQSRALNDLPPPVVGHVYDRPVCAACLAASQQTSRRRPA